MGAKIQLHTGPEEILNQLTALRRTEPWWFNTDEIDLMIRWDKKHQQGPNCTCRFDSYTQRSIARLAEKINRRLETPQGV